MSILEDIWYIKASISKWVSQLVKWWNPCFIGYESSPRGKITRPWSLVALVQGLGVVFILWLILLKTIVVVLFSTEGDIFLYAKVLRSWNLDTFIHLVYTHKGRWDGELELFLQLLHIISLSKIAWWKECGRIDRILREEPRPFETGLSHLLLLRWNIHWQEAMVHFW